MEVDVHAWDNPTDPNRRQPETPETPDTPDDPGAPRMPGERPPFEEDPEAQRAPGAGDDAPGGGPPMQASATDDVIYLDAPGAATEPVGNDNIREGRVGGVMGPKHAANGQGQGG
jgi:hypothetical protein